MHIETYFSAMPVVPENSECTMKAGSGQQVVFESYLPIPARETKERKLSDRKLVMDSTCKHLKGHEDFHVFADIQRGLYELWKHQIKTERSQIEAYLSKANPNKRFFNGKCCSRTAFAVTLTGSVYPFANY